MAKKKTTQEDQNTEINFETSLGRLEEILEKMNAGSLSLDDVLKHYEEADKLILGCHTKLTQAEQKVELLMKNREGKLQAQNEQDVETQPFETPSHSQNS
jgi:exodeoxyribonuclease VII small subunit